jgi:cell wall-associated NlpC family hydrolase
MTKSEKIENAVQVAWKFVGTFYTWGGDDPMVGFDCSGLANELLKVAGIIGRSEPKINAQGLYDRFKDKVITTAPYAGCLAFWTATSGNVIHVEFLINDEQTIGASGGGSKTLTKEDAIRDNAFVKVRPLRAGYKAIVDPFM